MSDRMKWLIGVAVVSLLGAALVAPVTAHPPENYGHVWEAHLKPHALDDIYSRAASNNRFLPNSNLPVGKTMRGVWGAIETGNAAAHHIQTFQQRLPANVVANYVVTNGAATLGTSNCPGTLNNPRARPGHLCVYEGYNLNLAGDFRFCFFRGNQLSQACQAVVGRDGFGLAVFPEILGDQYIAIGTWAVTAARRTPVASARLPGSAKALVGR
jgi:hypothetical protein